MFCIHQREIISGNSFAAAMKNFVRKILVREQRIQKPQKIFMICRRIKHIVVAFDGLVILEFAAQEFAERAVFIEQCRQAHDKTFGGTLTKQIFRRQFLSTVSGERGGLVKLRVIAARPVEDIIQRYVYVRYVITESFYDVFDRRNVYGVSVGFVRLAEFDVLISRRVNNYVGTNPFGQPQNFVEIAQVTRFVLRRENTL